MAARDSPATVHTYEAKVAGEDGDSDVDIEAGTEPVAVNQYVLHEKLGEGAYAVVRRGEGPAPAGAPPVGAGAQAAGTTDKADVAHYAVKVLNKATLKRRKTYKRVGRRMMVTTALDKAHKELAIMKAVAHGNVVRCFEIIDDPESDHMFLVLEFVPGGQLAQWDPSESRYHMPCDVQAPTLGAAGGEDASSAQSDPRAPAGLTLGDEGTSKWEVLRQRLKDVVDGLSYLHHNRIVHRDIKPENILVGEGGAAKLADLGVSHIFDEGQEPVLRGSEGTPYFMAPEMLSGKPFAAFPTDVWALGVTMYACAFGKLPFWGDNPLELNRSIVEDELTFPSDVDAPPEFMELVRGMLHKDPEQRLDLHALRHRSYLSSTTSPLKTPRPAQTIQVSDDDIKRAITPLSKFKVMSTVSLMVTRQLLRNRRRRKRRAARRKARNAELKSKLASKVTRMRRMSRVVRTLSQRALLGASQSPKSPAAPPTPPPRAMGASTPPPALPGVRETATVTESEQAGCTVVNGYKLCEELGRGAFGIVYRASCAHTGVPNSVAVKVLSKSKLSRKRDFKRVGRRVTVTTALDKVNTELAVMKKLCYRHVVRCFEIIDDPEQDSIYLVIELVPGGQLLKYDGKTFTAPGTGAPLSEDDCRRHFRHVLRGLEYLHSKRIAHRDIKPENVLVAPGCTKLSDLGCANFFGAPEDVLAEPNAHGKLTLAAGRGAREATSRPSCMVRDTAGTPAFLAPECHSGTPYNVYGADVWALGVTLYCMLFSRLPFAGTTLVEMARSVTNDEPSFTPSDGQPPVSEAATDLVRGLLTKDPAARLTIAQAKKHPWVTADGALKVWGVSQAPLLVTSDELTKPVTPVKSLEVLRTVNHALARLSRRRSRRNRLKQAKARSGSDASSVGAGSGAASGAGAGAGAGTGAGASSRVAPAAVAMPPPQPPRTQTAT